MAGCHLIVFGVAFVPSLLSGGGHTREVPTWLIGSMADYIEDFFLEMELRCQSNC